MSDRDEVTPVAADFAVLDIVGLVEAARRTDEALSGIELQDREWVTELDSIRDMLNVVRETTSDRWVYRSAT